MTVSDTAPIPSPGRIVHYVLNAQDAAEINKRRADYQSAQRHAIPPAVDGRQNHTGNAVRAGETYPAVIVRVWGGNPNSACNLQVLLDGNDTHWATSRSAHEEPLEGGFTWPERRRA